MLEKRIKRNDFSLGGVVFWTIWYLLSIAVLLLDFLFFRQHVILYCLAFVPMIAIIITPLIIGLRLFGENKAEIITGLIVGMILLIGIIFAINKIRNHRVPTSPARSQSRSANLG
jgi:hypothetical protein